MALETWVCTAGIFIPIAVVNCNCVQIYICVYMCMYMSYLSLAVHFIVESKRSPTNGIQEYDMYDCVCVHVCLRVCMYISIYMYVCLWVLRGIFSYMCEDLNKLLVLSMLFI